MHPNKINHYVKRISEVIDSATYTEGGRLIDRPRTDGHRGFVLEDESDALRKVINLDLYDKEKWKTKFSLDYIERHIWRIISSTVGTKDYTNVATDFIELVKSFDSFNSQNTVLLPIIGIALETPELRMGKYRIFRIPSDYLSEIIERTTQTINSGGQSEEVKALQIKDLNDRMPKHVGSLCVELTVVAEPARAVEIASEELELVLDLLRYAATIIEPSFFKVRIGLKGDFIRDNREIIIHSPEDLVFNTSLVGPLAPFRITREALQKMQKLGIFDLANYLSTSPKKDHIYETLLSSIHWFAHASQLPNNSDKILNCTTAIEVFFETREKPISATLAEAMALIFGDDIENRIEIRNVMKELYNKRSRITHGGFNNIPEKDVKQIQHLAAVLIHFVFRHREIFTTRSQFNKWIDDLRLGAGNNPNQWNQPN